VEKPGGGLAVNAELTANGAGMRVMRFFNTFRSLDVATKRRTTPPSTLAPTRASTYASDIVYPQANISSTAPAFGERTGISTTESVPRKTLEKKIDATRDLRVNSSQHEKENCGPRNKIASSSARVESAPTKDSMPRTKDDQQLSGSTQSAKKNDRQDRQGHKVHQDEDQEKQTLQEPETEPGPEKRARAQEDTTEGADEEDKKRRKQEKREENADAAAMESLSSKYSTINGPEKDKKNKPIYTFGNYEAYYGGRTEDCRWVAMESKLAPYIANGDVLDIGCNTGKISAAVARSEHWPKSVLGIDVDEGLISKANSRNWLENLRFEAQNWLQKENKSGEEYDVILCLSVVKWIHFQYGDHGIRRFFRKVHRKLRSGGIFVLESQDMKSYKKKRHLTPHIRENVRQIQLPPDDFPQFLESMGFELIDTIEPEKATAGFDRPIQLFKKKNEETEADDD